MITSAKFMASVSLALLIVACVLTGCQSLPTETSTSQSKAWSKSKSETNIEHKYIVEVNSDGFLLDQNNGRKALKSYAQVREYLETNIFDTFRNSGKTNILVFVHGGLNDQKQSTAYFKSDYEKILKGNYYPIFIQWPSGWWDTYWEHVFLVRQGIKEETASGKCFSYCTFPFVLLAELGRSCVRLPLIIANDSKTDMETALSVREVDDGAPVYQYQALAEQDYQLEIGNDYSTKWQLAGKHTVYWLTLPFRWVTSSFIDGFGTGAWDDMLRRTQQAYPEQINAQKSQQIKFNLQFRTNSTARLYSVTESNRADRFKAAGLPIFINELCNCQTNDPDFGEITLVGHSMGAIILNRILADSDIKASDIVYLAAACSVKDFSTSVLPYLEKNPQTRFYNLSLHPVAEASESEGFELLPRGSLLVWIDNFLQNPVSEQERTVGAWNNLFLSTSSGKPVIKQIFDDPNYKYLKERLYFRSFSVGSGVKLRDNGNISYQWNNDPKLETAEERYGKLLTHGSFSAMPYWTPEFWWQPANLTNNFNRP
jgi:hypothetical protein